MLLQQNVDFKTNDEEMSEGLFPSQFSNLSNIKPLNTIA